MRRFRGQGQKRRELLVVRTLDQENARYMYHMLQLYRFSVLQIVHRKKDVRTRKPEGLLHKAKIKKKRSETFFHFLDNAPGNHAVKAEGVLLIEQHSDYFLD